MEGKKWICGVSMLAICFMFAGCGHEHTWIDATCSESKHCSVCGETDGQPLEHTLIEANYQQPATCEVCGATVGEPLQADFEKYGLTCDAKLNVEYPCKTICSENRDCITTAKVTFSDYEIFSSDDAHEALEGYEWRAVTTTWILDDENAVKYGFESDIEDSDYYDIVGMEDSCDEVNKTFKVTYNGMEYSDACYDYEDLSTGWVDNVFSLRYRLYYRVPIGYDGVVIACYNSANNGNGIYINELVDDDSIIFRLK